MKLAIAFSIGVVGLVQSACADTAILVGINKYPYLPNATLEGCENDIDNMKAALGKRGFTEGEFVMFKSEQATKEAILNAWRRAVANGKPGSRIHYHHSSHGAKAGNGISTLLTASSRGQSVSTDLTSFDFKPIIDTARAKGIHVTFIVDACHSEGVLSKSVNPFKGKPRYFERTAVKGGPDASQFGTTLNRSTPSFRSDEFTSAPNQGLFAQYVAARYAQYAFETKINNLKQGVFTFYLAQVIASGAKVSWPQVTATVNGKVSSYSKDEQIPVYTGPAFEFLSAPQPAAPTPPKPPTNPPSNTGGQGTNQSGGGTAVPPNPTPVAPSAPAPGSLDWPVNFATFSSLYAFDNTNSNAVTVSMTDEKGKPYPAGTTIRLKGDQEQYVVFTINARRPGFYLILDRDSNDRVQVMNADLSATVPEILQALQVDQPRALRFPEGKDQAIRFNQTGPEKIKVVYFQDEADAEKAVTALKKAMKNKSLGDRENLESPFSGLTFKLKNLATADLRFQIAR